VALTNDLLAAELGDLRVADERGRVAARGCAGAFPTPGWNGLEELLPKFLFGGLMVATVEGPHQPDAPRGACWPTRSGADILEAFESACKGGDQMIRPLSAACPAGRPVLVGPARTKKPPSAMDEPMGRALFHGGPVGHGRHGGAACPISQVNINVNPKPVLVEYDIANVEFAKVDLGWCLYFQFTPAARARDLLPAERVQPGRGGLVLMLNDAPVGARRLDQPGGGREPVDLRRAGRTRSCRPSRSGSSAPRRPSRRKPSDAVSKAALFALCLLAAPFGGGPSASSSAGPRPTRRGNRARITRPGCSRPSRASRSPACFGCVRSGGRTVSRGARYPRDGA